MEQLLAVDTVEAFNEFAEATSARERTAPSPVRSEPTQAQQPVTVGHHLKENPVTVDCEQGIKRRHRSCKVCAIYKVKPRKFTKYFCPECSNRNKRQGGHVLSGLAHNGNNGNDIPRELELEHNSRDRPPASRPGKKRRHTAPCALPVLLWGQWLARVHVADAKI
ncbi:hypothetical protein PC120_g16739 [Phytophthora cactorum]|nr:hypothetical protein PC120_g16739 [Phytophthora cactorum]